MLPVDAKNCKICGSRKTKHESGICSVCRRRKKLARVFGAANERRWTRSDYAEGKQGEELYMSNAQGDPRPGE